ncbi:MAG: protein-disulfide reductase DsbD family protein, partial [Verrucomicrobia bacterium]|nr:protein-disulfide reductase DsbD family protein [Verrucomicrobiota bacterium]
LAMRIVCIWIVTLALVWPAWSAAPGSTTQASLLLSAAAARPGETIMAGVRLKMAPKWHTYWRNAGESGQATTIEWTLPAGVRAGPIQWPAPEKLTLEDVTTYVYDKEVVLLVPLTLEAGAARGEQEIVAKVSWLECEVACVPGQAVLRAKLNIADESRASGEAALLKNVEALIPKPEPRLQAHAWWEKGATANARFLVMEWTALKAQAQGDFFPYESETLEIAPKTEAVPAANGTTRLRKEAKKSEGNWPKEVAGLILEKAGPGTPVAYEVKLAVEDPGPAQSKAGSTAPSGPSSANLSAKPGTSLGVILINVLLALGGGLILNLMPCVLPILSLKILSFVRQGAASQAENRKLSLVYLLGVLASFWVLAGLVMAHKLASYGEQFQDPRFVIAITALITLVALNLFGVFEFVLPGRAMTAAGALSSREGAAGALLAAAVGWAVSQAPLVILLIFTMIGLGFGLPYVVLSFFPRMHRLLPKPGLWMEKFKVAMGFPMLAVAVWLFALVVDHFGRDGALWVGLFLVLLGVAAWVFGEFVQRGGKHKGWAAVLAVGLVAAGYAYGLEHKLNWRNPAEAGEGARVRPARSHWTVMPTPSPGSPGAPQRWRKRGRKAARCSWISRPIGV